MKAKFNNSETFIQIQSWSIGSSLVTMIADGITENLSGFVLYEDDGVTVVMDCSDFIYRWDIYDQREDRITLTNSETDRQRKPDQDAGSPKEIIDPLSNEELTEAVADLMYEVS